MAKVNKKYKDPPKYIPFGSKEHLEWGQVALFEQTKILQEVHDRFFNQICTFILLKCSSEIQKLRFIKIIFE